MAAVYSDERRSRSDARAYDLLRPATHPRHRSRSGHRSRSRHGEDPPALASPPLLGHSHRQERRAGLDRAQALRRERSESLSASIQDLGVDGDGTLMRGEPLQTPLLIEVDTGCNPNSPSESEMGGTKPRACKHGSGGGKAQGVLQRDSVTRPECTLSSNETLSSDHNIKANNRAQEPSGSMVQNEIRPQELCVNGNTFDQSGFVRPLHPASSFAAPRSQGNFSDASVLQASKQYRPPRAGPTIMNALPAKEASTASARAKFVKTSSDESDDASSGNISSRPSRHRVRRRSSPNNVRDAAKSAPTQQYVPRSSPQHHVQGERNSHASPPQSPKTQSTAPITVINKHDFGGPHSTHFQERYASPRPSPLPTPRPSPPTSPVTSKPRTKPVDAPFENSPVIHNPASPFVSMKVADSSKPREPGQEHKRTNGQTHPDISSSKDGRASTWHNFGSQSASAATHGLKTDFQALPSEDAQDPKDFQQPKDLRADKSGQEPPRTSRRPSDQHKIQESLQASHLAPRSYQRQRSVSNAEPRRYRPEYIPNDKSDGKQDCTRADMGERPSMDQPREIVPGATTANAGGSVQFKDDLLSPDGKGHRSRSSMGNNLQGSRRHRSRSRTVNDTDDNAARRSRSSARAPKIAFSDDKKTLAPPSCPRPDAAAGYDDWYILERCSQFIICPECRHSIFGRGYDLDFQRKTEIKKSKKIRCAMNDPWTRLACVLAFKQDRRPMKQLATLANISDDLPSCPGSRPSQERDWYHLRDSETGLDFLDFQICAHCVESIDTIFPKLHSIFHPSKKIKEEAHVCSLRSDNGRFGQYLNLLIDMHSKAESRRISHDANSASAGPSDIIETSDLIWEIKWLTVISPCQGAAKYSGSDWHVHRTLPQLTVCEECYFKVVRPVIRSGALSHNGSTTINNNNSNSNKDSRHKQRIAKDISPQAKEIVGPTSCKLYSARMRQVFTEACEDDDWESLEAAVMKRSELSRDIDRLRLELERRPGDADLKTAVEHYEAKWKRLERKHE